MTEIADRYRARADAFARTVAAVAPDRWSHPSPCAGWTARDVVAHIVDMHAVMLRPVGRGLGPAPSLADDPLGAFTAARTDVEAVLDDPDLAATVQDTPAGRMTAEQQIDQVVSADMVLHRWDLARATGQDDTIDPAELDGALALAQHIPDEMRIPDHNGPGITVFGPAVAVPEDAPVQDRLLGLLGRDPHWSR